jgi:hypothetical protein
MLTGTAGFAFTNAPSGSINSRLDNMIIPVCEFREANAIDVLEFIVSSAIYLSEAPTVSIGLGGTAIDYPEIFDHTLPAITNLPSITLNVRRIPTRDLLNDVTKSLNLRYSVTDTSILIFTANGTLLNKNESVEQAGPAYPPQSVGSADP